MKKGYFYSRLDEQFIEGNHGVLSIEQIAEHLGRSRNAIRYKMVRMGLIKRGEVKSGWKKGVTPEHLKATMFKKGRSAPHAAKLGDIRIRKELSRRIKEVKTDSGWRSLACVNMEKHIGRKLNNAEDRIVFIDGDRMNCDISNLSLGSKSKILKNSMTRERRLAAAKKSNATKMRKKKSRQFTDEVGFIPTVESMNEIFFGQQLKTKSR